MSYSETRLDRQLIIEGWNQEALDKAKVGVIGGHGYLDSIFMLSASALGINNMTFVSPEVDDDFHTISQHVNPYANIKIFEGYYSGKFVDRLVKDRDIIIDLGNYNLATKLAIERAHKSGKPVIKANIHENGFDIFTYQRGREWEELKAVMPKKALPSKDAYDDPILDIVAAGIVLEETKNYFMEKKTSEDLISYRKPPYAFNKKKKEKTTKALVVGSGGLGNFVGPGLGFLGVQDIMFMDMDEAEEVNLNRQVFLYDGIGENKAKTLSHKMNSMFSINSTWTDEPFTRDTDVSNYDVLFDCVDNFETRILLSEAAQRENKILVSGGTNINNGQVIPFNPQTDKNTPAEALGLYEIVRLREAEELEKEDASCIARPNPSVIMTNQIIAGLMVDSWRKIKNGYKAERIFYDSTSPTRM